MIETHDLRVTYGRTVALDSLTVSIPEGITGLFGQNGSGKSTLLRALAGLLRPAAGEVRVLGRRAGDPSVRAVTGYVGHGAGLYARLTVEENLDLFARLHGAPPAAVARVLWKLGLEQWRTTRAGELSAGLKRRAAVARALVSDPMILLLDEPFANLDDEAGELLTRAVLEWKEPGRVCVIATHGAKRVKAFAGAGVILQRGRLVTQGVYRQDREVRTS
ncbi:MAG TPA: heme ABC exporter ATP-binding protein CcmA [Actinomycetota bacterium]|nr:heme ABC exporter ATP-binding protein CcmA [Actinomycetota bacterium]